MLQRKLKAVVDEAIILLDVVHVMLYRRILPLQVRELPMWDYKPDDDAVAIAGWISMGRLGPFVVWRGTCTRRKE